MVMSEGGMQLSERHKLKLAGKNFSWWQRFASNS